MTISKGGRKSDWSIRRHREPMNPTIRFRIRDLRPQRSGERRMGFDSFSNGGGEDSDNWTKKKEERGTTRDDSLIAVEALIGRGD
ncbi:hypothetical protein Nepgr_030778 [Nepenthes gracilis]|uniref:Uncharacterized protein n=1 Tax=Nepenthes gracilis TaxID=150966 RepID=A0AAD3Y651_NEPGR|nr:hypothetical protein Nepgr_030778 [Nepenthes gracilis]